MTEYSATGKFLITGEYLILHGARALAVPLAKKIQSLTVTAIQSGKMNWKAFDENDHLWFSTEFFLPELDFNNPTDEKMALQLQGMLRFIEEQKPELFINNLSFETRMNFSSSWGLGSSSTLVSLLSQWSGIDAYLLQKKFFGGSGYDIACATATTPIIYQLQNQKPVVTPVTWSPSFKHNLYFLYLGQKQDSRDAMASFKKQTPVPSPEDILKINSLTEKFLTATDLKEFQLLMHEHEKLLSKLLGMTPVKEKLFSDFKGELKSLGGWGGDFIMVASEENPVSYFKAHGLNLLLKWDDLIL
jgi:mevalonate kinase